MNKEATVWDEGGGINMWNRLTSEGISLLTCGSMSCQSRGHPTGVQRGLLLCLMPSRALTHPATRVVETFDPEGGMGN